MQQGEEMTRIPEIVSLFDKYANVVRRTAPYETNKNSPCEGPTRYIGVAVRYLMEAL